MNGVTSDFPRLVSDDVLAYVKFLMEWTDAAPLTVTGQVHHCLITLPDDEGKKEKLSAQAFNMKRLSTMVKWMSEGVACFTTRPACSAVVRNAMTHVMTDKIVDNFSAHRAASLSAVTTSEKLLSAARSAQYRGPLVILLFHSNESVRIWARETLLRLVDLAASPSSLGTEGAANAVWLLSMQLLCTVRHVTGTPLRADEEDERNLVADGTCSLLAVFTTLDAKLTGLERLLMQNGTVAGEDPSPLFGGVSTATVLLLGGSMLLYWIFSAVPEKDTKTVPSITQKLAMAINTRLGMDTTLQPVSLAGDARRALVKILVHCLFVTAKLTVTSAGVNEMQCQRRMRDLWYVSSHIDPPPIKTTKMTTAVSSESAGASSNLPGKSAGWLLRFLMRNASVQLNLPLAVQGAASGDTVDVTILQTMEVAVHVISCMLTSLVDSLPCLVVSHYYHQFLMTVQKDCVALAVGVLLRAQNPRSALALLQHFIFTDLIIFGCDQLSHPAECLRDVWEAFAELLQQLVYRRIHKTVASSSSSSSPSLLQQVMEVLVVAIAHPSACAWLFLKPLKDGPQPLARVVAKSIERVTEIFQKNMKELRDQGGAVIGNGCNNSMNADEYVSHVFSRTASQLISSGSSIPCVTYALIISNDVVTQRLGEVLSSLFLSSFSSVVHHTFRADAANWLFQVILQDPVLQEKELKLHDAKVGAVVRINGSIWASIMCHCNWSNLPDDVLTASWWICALLVDVCVLEMTLGDRLLELVVTQLPSLTGETTTLGRHANYSNSPSLLYPSVSGGNLKSSLSSQSLLDCAQHLLLMLVQKCFVYSTTTFTRAVLHIAGALPPPRKCKSDKSFTNALSNAFNGTLQKLPAEAVGMMMDYAPVWLSEILRSARQSIDDTVADQKRRFQEYELEEKRLRQLEQTDHKRAEQEKIMCHVNMERRRQELENEREKASKNPCVARTNVGVKRPRDDVPSLMIAQTLADDDDGSAVSGNLKQLQQQGVRHEHTLDTVTSASPLEIASLPPLHFSVLPSKATALQKRLHQLGEQRVSEVSCAEKISKAVEAIYRVAGSTDVHYSTPRTDDIVGHGRHCLTVEVPVIPHCFTETTSGGYDLYVTSFLPHIALELRYELHQKFEEMLDLCRAWDSSSSRGAKCTKTSSAPRTSVTSNGDNTFPHPSVWITKNAMAVVGAGDALPNPMDPTCLRFSVMLKAIADTGNVSSLSAGLSEGDVAVVLMPLPQLAASLPRLFNGVGNGLPHTWRVLGCVPQLCVVTSLQPGNRTVTLTLFTSSTASLSSNANNDGNDTITVNFLHMLHAFSSLQAHFFIRRLSSLGPSVTAVNAIHKIRSKMFASALLKSHVAAKTSRMFYHAVEQQLLSCERWRALSCCLLLHSCLNEWQMRAIATVLVAVAPGWDKAAQQVTPPDLSLPMPPDFFIIEGPPGTGKTQTIAALTLNLFHNLPKGARRVLVCAPSNCAVDEVLLRVQGLSKLLPELGDLRLLRVGVRENVDRDVLAASPPLFLDDCVGALNNGFNNLLLLGTTGRGLHSGNSDGAINNNRQQLRDHLIYEADVVCSTLGSLSQLQRLDFLFDVVIVDEASQGTEPDVLQALMLAKRRVVLVGDSKQLQPTVLCPISAACGLKRSLLQRLLNQGHKSSLLRTQYRMHPDICDFPNRYFYNGKLITDISVMTRRRSVSLSVLPLPNAIENVPRFLFVDVQEGRMDLGKGRSLMNRWEAEAVVKQMRRFRAILQLTPEAFAQHAGIITFYQAQKEAILRLLSYEERQSRLQIATVDSFQGKEKNIIFISCVRAPHVGSRHYSAVNLGFLEDWHRINVALTRAKEFCVLFGHRQTFHDAAHVAAKKQQQKKQKQKLELPPVQLNCTGDNVKEEKDNDVICEEAPLVQKSDDDPFVLHQLVCHVMHLSTGQHQEGLNDAHIPAAIFTNSGNLHIVNDLLLHPLVKKKNGVQNAKRE